MTAATAAAVVANMGPTSVLNSYQYGQVGVYAFYRIGKNLPSIGTVVAPGGAYWFVPDTQIDPATAAAQGGAAFAIPLGFAAMPLGRVRTGWLFDHNPLIGYVPPPTLTPPTAVDMSTLNNGGYTVLTNAGLPNGSVWELRSKKTGRVYWYVPLKWGAGGGGMAYLRPAYAASHGGVPFTATAAGIGTGMPPSESQAGYLFTYNPKAWAFPPSDGVAYTPGIGGKAATMDAVVGIGTIVLAVAGGAFIGGAFAAAAGAGVGAGEGSIALADTLGTSALDTAGFGTEFLGAGADAITGAGVTNLTAYGDIALTNAALASGGVAVDVGYNAAAYVQPVPLGLGDVPRPGLDQLAKAPVPDDPSWLAIAGKAAGAVGAGGAAISAVSKIHDATAPAKKPLVPIAGTDATADAGGLSSIGNFALIALGLVGMMALA